MFSKKYESVTIVGVRMDNPYAMPFEHHNIYLLRNRRPSAPLNRRRIGIIIDGRMRLRVFVITGNALHSSIWRSVNDQIFSC